MGMMENSKIVMDKKEIEEIFQKVKPYTSLECWKCKVLDILWGHVNHLRKI